LRARKPAASSQSSLSSPRPCAREVISAAESPNTRRAYTAQFRKFDAWCKRRRTAALPSTPAVVAAYLVDLAKTGADPSDIVV
jgi:hypothetical protein